MIKDVRTELLTIENLERYKGDIMMRQAAVDQLAKALPTGSLHLIIALHNEALVGQVGILPSGPTESDTIPYISYPTPVLTFMEVKPEHRGRGVGRLLLKTACKFAADSLGATDIFLTVGVDNNSARRLYENEGFEDWGHGTVMRPHFPLQADGSYLPEAVHEERYVMIKNLASSS